MKKCMKTEHLSPQKTTKYLLKFNKTEQNQVNVTPAQRKMPSRQYSGPNKKLVRGLHILVSHYLCNISPVV